MTETCRVLVVDNEAQMTRLVVGLLTRHGYEVRSAPDGKSALADFSDWRPHLVVADVYTLGIDGVELCRRIRAISRVPIIVLSAKDAEVAKVAALDSGADDYVTKPFAVNEFLARVRAALRRAGESTPDDTGLDVGDFRVDLAARRVYVGGAEVRLTPKEFDLFLYLARRPNRVIEHRRLLEAVWGESSREHPEYLRVFVGQLRKKLEPVPSVPRYLATEPWIGYRFNPSGESSIRRSGYESVLGVLASSTP
jgi:two-component system, OmpR family, KDP operon response regulator KdpE